MFALEKTSYVAQVSAPRATLAEAVLHIRDLSLNEATAIEHLKVHKVPYRVSLMTLTETTYMVGSLLERIFGRGVELKFASGVLVSLVMR